MLPKLRGSTKQVASAHKIRTAYLAAIDRHNAVILESLQHSRTMHNKCETLCGARAESSRTFASGRTAGWWIEHRGLTVHGVAAMAQQEMQQSR